MTSSSDVRSERETRQAQRDILAAYLRAHPLIVLSAEDLIALVGPNYRSRISDCVKQLGMTVRNVPRYHTYSNAQGKVRRQRLIGGYMFTPSAHRESGQLVLELRVNV